MREEHTRHLDSHNPESTAPDEKPLQSWKEIAAYLDRDVRTARRWEKEAGLPVRRHRQVGKSSVYAYPSEVNAWRSARMPRGSEATSASPLWKHPAVAMAAGVALVLGGLVLFHERMPTPDDLLVEAADPGSGRAARQVWDGDASAGSVSPDGRYLTFTDWATGDLAVRDLETGENHRLTRKGTWNESQEFAEWSVISPDGRQVAYSWRDENNFYHLRTIGFEDEGGGAQPRVLIRADADTPYLIPTTGLPGGKRVACSVWRGDGTIDLVLVSADDGTVTRLKSLEWRTSVFAAASPDGRFLAYDVQQSPDEDKFNIRVIVIDGSRDIPLIEHAGSDSVLGWASDGSGLLFRSDRRGSDDVWFVPVHDGKATGRSRLVRSGAGSPLGLTADGSFFYSMKLGGDDIYTADLDPETGRLAGEPRKMVLPGNLWVSELARGTDVRGSGGTCDRWIQRIVDLLPSRSGRAGGHLGSAHQR